MSRRRKNVHGPPEGGRRVKVACHVQELCPDTTLERPIGMAAAVTDTVAVAFVKEICFTSTENRSTLVMIQATKVPGGAEIRVRLSLEMLESPNQNTICSEAGCGQVVSRNCSWVRHFQKHLPEIPAFQSTVYVCGSSTCLDTGTGQDISFDRIQGLRQHYRKCHAKKNFVCANCSKAFPTESYLKIHAIACGIRFECASCPKGFDSLESLRTHARRLEHQIDADHYKNLIRERKKEIENESGIFKKPLKPCKSLSRVLDVPPISTMTSSDAPHHFVSILPKLPADASEFARNAAALRQLFGVPVQAHIGTQTAPRLVRKRSASQHCQTESKVTKTTGTLTFTALGSDQPVSKKRRASAQTQTKKLKVSTETQTPVVTKRRKVSTRRLQLSSTTTQTSPVKGPCPSVTPPEVTFTLPSPPTQSEVKVMTSLLCNEELLDEVNIETQTDPNPFFGYPNSLDQPPEDIFLSEEAELSEDGAAKTIETQTSPRRRPTADWGSMSGNYAPPPLFYFPVSVATETGHSEDRDTVSRSLGQELDKLGIYFETMDSETQTNFNFEWC